MSSSSSNSCSGEDSDSDYQSSSGSDDDDNQKFIGSITSRERRSTRSALNGGRWNDSHVNGKLAIVHVHVYTIQQYLI